MRKPKPFQVVAIITAMVVVVALPVYAATSIYNAYAITTNSTGPWIALDPGQYVIEIYAPRTTAQGALASDPCGTAGGLWDSANATIQYTPDYEVTSTNITDPVLVGATDDVIADVFVGGGYKFRIVVASVGAATCINWKAAKVLK